MHSDLISELHMHGGHGHDAPILPSAVSSTLLHGPALEAAPVSLRNCRLYVQSVQRWEARGPPAETHSAGLPLGWRGDCLGAILARVAVATHGPHARCTSIATRQLSST